MTAAEHAKVWRKIAQEIVNVPFAPQGADAFANAVATAYEQAAKEQEGRE